MKVLINGGEYWFLYTLFIIFLIYPLIYKFIRNNIYRSIGLLAFTLLLHFILPSIDFLTLDSVIYYMFYFMLGSIVKNFYGSKVFEIKLNKIKTSFTVLILFIIWLILIKQSFSYTSVIVPLLGIITFYICMQYDWLVQLFKEFGKYSLQLYLLNGFLLVISRTIIVSVLGVTSPFLIIAFNVLVDFFVSFLIIKYICEKVKPVRFLMGIIE